VFKRVVGEFGAQSLLHGGPFRQAKNRRAVNQQQLPRLIDFVGAEQDVGAGHDLVD
jgi:hypothetical protein